MTGIRHRWRECTRVAWVGGREPAGGPASDLPAESAPLQFPDELVFVRKVACLVFRIDQRAIDVNVENAAGPFYQERLGAECFF